eukprot:1152020-Pelagomonas_calceolata.AAC.4
MLPYTRDKRSIDVLTSCSTHESGGELMHLHPALHERHVAYVQVDAHEFKREAPTGGQTILVCGSLVALMMEPSALPSSPACYNAGSSPDSCPAGSILADT